VSACKRDNSFIAWKGLKEKSVCGISYGDRSWNKSNASLKQVMQQQLRHISNDITERTLYRNSEGILKVFHVFKTLPLERMGKPQ
jgi:hypothetical protein